jgi:hypothetical protein
VDIGRNLQRVSVRVRVGVRVRVRVRVIVGFTRKVSKSLARILSSPVRHHKCGTRFT